MTPYGLDIPDAWNWNAISNPDIYGKINKILPQVLDTTETATASTTQIFQLRTLKIIQVLIWV